MLNGKYTVSRSNFYRKPTPLWLKILADCLIGSILVVDGLMTQLPDFEGRDWVVIGWSAFVALFKLVSKTIADAKAEYYNPPKP